MREHLLDVSDRLTSRPGRRALVATDLASLHGPTGGVVRLPHRMVWLDSARWFDLDDPFDLRRLYEIVLREAVTSTELTTWLQAATLRRIWPSLYLPRGVQQAWELRHPELPGHRAAA